MGNSDSIPRQGTRNRSCSSNNGGTHRSIRAAAQDFLIRRRKRRQRRLVLSFIENMSLARGKYMDPEEQIQPELFRLVSRKNDCDWNEVRRVLDRMERSVRELRLFLLNDIELPPRREHSIVRDIKEMMWTHPTTGGTALHLAVCINPPLDVMERFSRLGLGEVSVSTPWITNSAGASPLHHACSHGASVQTVKALIDSVHTINAGGKREYVRLKTYENGYTALHCAAMLDAPLEVLELLVDIEPALLLEKDHRGITPLDTFCRSHGGPLLLRINRKLGLLSSDQSVLPERQEDTELLTTVPRALEAAVRNLAQTFYVWPESEDFFLDIALEFWSRSTFLLRRIASYVTGRPFDTNRNILHAAACIPGECPKVLLKFLILSVPSQSMDRDGPLNELPLHIAVRSSPTSLPNLKHYVHLSRFETDTKEDLEEWHDVFVRDPIDLFLTYGKLDAACQRNGDGKLPVQVAMEVGHRERVRHLLLVQPYAAASMNWPLHLYPHILAAAGTEVYPEVTKNFLYGRSCSTLGSETHHEATEAARVAAIFEFLRNKPEIVGT